MQLGGLPDAGNSTVPADPLMVDLVSGCKHNASTIRKTVVSRIVGSMESGCFRLIWYGFHTRIYLPPIPAADLLHFMQRSEIFMQATGGQASGLPPEIIGGSHRGVGYPEGTPGGRIVTGTPPLRRQ